MRRDPEPTFLGAELALNSEVGYVFEPMSVEYGVRGIPRTSCYVRTGSRAEPAVAGAMDALLGGRARFHRPSVADGPPAPAPVRVARTMLVSRINVRYQLQARDPRRRRWLLKDPLAAFAAEWFQRATAPVSSPSSPPGRRGGSYLRLGWRFNLGDLIAQDELMADHLGTVLGHLDPRTSIRRPSIRCARVP